MEASTNNERQIAVFDSGVGGISVLRKLTALLPEENFWFYGDSAHAPYGTKTIEEVRNFTDKAISPMVEAGVKAVVIACNTATSAAKALLQEKFPDTPIIGMEPALKPAVISKPGSRILVMATPMTLSLSKFRTLMSRFEGQADIILKPCPGLADIVETGRLDTPDTRAFLRNMLQEYIDDPVDSVVIGCTHYPFVQPELQEILGSKVKFFDGAVGTTYELKRRLEKLGMLNKSGKKGSVKFDSSKDTPEELALYEKLYTIEIK